MKINPLSTYGVYPSVHVNGAGKARRVVIPTPENTLKTDTISFSAGAREQQEVSQISSRILTDLKQPESSARLTALQNQIAAGSYYVSAGELADAILSRGVL